MFSFCFFLKISYKIIITAATYFTINLVYTSCFVSGSSPASNIFSLLTLLHIIGKRFGGVIIHSDGIVAARSSNGIGHICFWRRTCPLGEAQRWCIPKTIASLHAHRARRIYHVVFFCHGFCIRNSCYFKLLGHIASHGFIVVAPQPVYRFWKFLIIYYFLRY